MVVLYTHLNMLICSFIQYMLQGITAPTAAMGVFGLRKVEDSLLNRKGGLANNEINTKHEKQARKR